MPDPAKRLLFLAHMFPPAGGGGVQRAAKFAKFLPRLGWRVTVVTTQAELYRDLYGIHDPTLLAELPPEVEIIRVRSSEGRDGPPRPLGIPIVDTARALLSRLRNVPDASRCWRRPVLQHFEREEKAPRWSVLLATGNPFSVFLIARELAGRLAIPYVLDFRDPWWVGWGLSPLSRSRRWERQVIDGAARIIVVTEAMRRLYADAFPACAARFSIIENGVDLEEACRREPVEPSRERFDIVYAGTLLPNRSPHCFLQGFRAARERSTEFARNARFVLIGRIGWNDATARENRSLVERLRLAEAVVERGYLTHNETVRAQRSAGVLLNIGAAQAFAAAGKTYEYIAAERPILALTAPGGEAERVLRCSPMTVFARWDDPGDVADKLLGLFARWQRGELFGLPAPEVPEEYTRAYQARQLDAVLTEVLTTPAGPRGK